MSRTDRRLEAPGRVADHDPELAARLVLMTLLAVAASAPATMTYELEVDGVGAYRVSAGAGRARVDPVSNGEPTDFKLSTDVRSLVDLALGRKGALALALRRRLRIHGSRRRALALRKLAAAQPEAAAIVRAGGSLDPDLLYRALPYMIDPDWTRGHRFTVGLRAQRRRRRPVVRAGPRWRAPGGDHRGARPGRRDRPPLHGHLPAARRRRGDGRPHHARPAHAGGGPDLSRHVVGTLDRSLPGEGRRRAGTRAGAATDPGGHSSEVYGYAYRALARRMKILGLEAPPPEELMPGPIGGA